MMNASQQFGFQADSTAQGDMEGLGFTPDVEPKKSKQQSPLTEQVETLLSAPGQTLLEGGQALSNIVQGLPGAGLLARGVMKALPESVRRGLSKLQVKGDIEPQAPAPVKFAGSLLGGGTAVELGGAGAGAALKALPEGMSAIVKAIQKSPRIARMLGTSSAGALTSPGQRVKGAAEGAILGSTVEGVGSTAQVAKFGVEKAKDLLKPIFGAETGAQDVLDKMGSGETLEGNSKSAAADIKAKKEEIEKESDKNFSPIFKQVGEKNIYPDLPKKEPSLIQLLPETLAKDKKTTVKLTGEYRKLPKSILNEYTPDLKELHNEFIKKPTFRNSANLRTELGAESARPATDVLGRRAKQAVVKGRKTLSNDMFSFLDRADESGDLKNQYQKAIDYHRNEYVPYKSNRQIWKIANGEVTNPRNLTTIFKSPEGEEEGENFTKTQKVLNDLGSNFNNKILFNELGKAKDAKDLVSRFKKLDQQRLGSYVTTDLKKNIDGVEAKLGRKEIAKRAAGGLGGAAVGSMSGFPIIGTTTGATLGATVLPKLLKGLAIRGFGGARRGFPAASTGTQNLQRIARMLLASRWQQQ